MPHPLSPGLDPTLPSQAPAEDIPNFIRAKVPQIPQVAAAPSDTSNAYINPWSPTIHVQNTQAWNSGQGTPQHEYEHAYERQVRGLGSTLMSGEPQQDFGGVVGLQQHPNINQLNVEQRAEATGQAYAAQKHAAQLARQAAITPQQVSAFDQWKAAAHPILQQIKNLGDSTIDTHPAAPGLPPAAIGGIIAPDPLLGGEWAQVPSARIPHKR